MALSQDLEIYSTAKSLMATAMDVVKAMPRDYRQVAGNLIMSCCVEIVTLISRTNCAFGEERVPFLATLLERVETVTVMFRVCHEKKFIGHDLEAQAIELTNSVGKQANGWLTQSGGRRAIPLSPTPVA